MRKAGHCVWRCLQAVCTSVPRMWLVSKVYLDVGVHSLPVLHGRLCYTSYTTLYLVRGADHELGADDAVKLLAGDFARLDGRLAERDALLVRVLGDGSSGVVASDGIQARNEHQTLVHDLVNLLLVRLDADNAVLAERVGSVSEEADRLEEVFDKNGLEDVKLKLTVRAGNRDGGVVTHDLGADHGHGLALGGVDPGS